MSQAETFQSGSLMRICALGGWAGAIALIAAIIVAPFFVPHHDWIADTISDLGAGEYEWIADFGLFSFAGGLMMLAVGAAHMHPGGNVGWTVGLLTLLVLGLLVTVIGARNEYGDDDTGGVVIHAYLVYALGVGFALAPFAMASQVEGGMARTFRVFGGLWAITAPLFFFLPTGVDGVYERALGLIALGWTSSLALVFWRHAARHG